MTKVKVKFSKQNDDFISELREKVKDYFKKNNISKHGNVNLVAKTVFMFSLYLAPYFLIGSWLFGLSIASILFSISSISNRLSIAYLLSWSSFLSNSRFSCSIIIWFLQLRSFLTPVILSLFSFQKTLLNSPRLLWL